MAEDLSAMHGRAGALVTSVAMLQYRQACEVASCGALLFGGWRTQTEQIQPAVVHPFVGVPSG